MGRNNLMSGLAFVIGMAIGLMIATTGRGLPARPDPAVAAAIERTTALIETAGGEWTPDEGCAALANRMSYTACITSLVYTEELSPEEAAELLHDHVAEMERFGDRLRSAWGAPARPR